MTSGWRSKRKWLDLLIGAIALYFLGSALVERVQQPERPESDPIALGVLVLLFAVQGLTRGDEKVRDWLGAALFVNVYLYFLIDALREARDDSVARWILLGTVSLLLLIAAVSLVRRRLLAARSQG